MFNTEDTTLSSMPDSYVVELQGFAKDQMENVMIKSDDNDESIGFAVATTPPSIYDFQGDCDLDLDLDSRFHCSCASLRRWCDYSRVHSNKIKSAENNVASG